MANMPKFKLSEKAKRRAAKIRATQAAKTPQMGGGPKPPKVKEPVSKPAPKPKPGTLLIEEGEAAGRRVTVEKQIKEAARRQAAGKPVTKPQPLKQLPAKTATVAPKPPKAPGLGQRISQKLKKAKMPRIGSEKWLKEGSRVVPFSRGKPTPEGAGLIRRAARATGRFVAPAVRRVAPGAVAGASLLSQAAPEGQKGQAAKVGAVLGGAVSAVAPKLATRVALPVAAVEGARTTYQAAKEYKKAKEAYGHLKKHAKGLKKAGYRVRAQGFGSAITGVRLDPKKKGGFFGGATFTDAGPNIRLEKVGKGQYTPGAAPPWAKKKKKRR